MGASGWPWPPLVSSESSFAESVARGPPQAATRARISIEARFIQPPSRTPGAESRQDRAHGTLFGLRLSSAASRTDESRMLSAAAPARDAVLERVRRGRVGLHGVDEGMVGAVEAELAILRERLVEERPHLPVRGGVEQRM